MSQNCYIGPSLNFMEKKQVDFCYFFMIIFLNYIIIKIRN